MPLGTLRWTDGSGCSGHLAHLGLGCNGHVQTSPVKRRSSRHRELTCSRVVL